MPDDLTIYHNPRCSTSRKTLDLLRERGEHPEIVEYLKTPPTKAQLKKILKRMNARPRDIVRTKEPLYKELGLDDPGTTDEALLDAMVAHPILIERPIVVKGDRAALARPISNVEEIL